VTKLPGPTKPPAERGEPLFRLWLAGCDGLRVDAGAGAGRVLERMERDESGLPFELKVRIGFRRRHRVRIPAGNVTAIDPERRRVFFRGRADRGGLRS
jgi:hypothetical protein